MFRHVRRGSLWNGTLHGGYWLPHWDERGERECFLCPASGTRCPCCRVSLGLWMTWYWVVTGRAIEAAPWD